jgi:2,3-bisphosphoglycerate-dependent phosphoglycerate mutase
MIDLVLVRHGQSAWNLENRFTGWEDVDLSEQGREEARRAGRLLKEAGHVFDRAYESMLKRAVRTLWILLEELDQMALPITPTWLLNERHYGALTGMDKREAAARFGEEQVRVWRRSFATPPPPMDPGDPRHPALDPRYRSVPRDRLPASESLSDTCRRVIPFFTEELRPRMLAGERLLVVAHGNSLRALVMHLDGLSEEAVQELNIPTGFPLVYRFDPAGKPAGRRYLGDPEDLRRAIEGVAAQARPPRP